MTEETQQQAKKEFSRRLLIGAFISVAAFIALAVFFGTMANAQEVNVTLPNESTVNETLQSVQNAAQNQAQFYDGIVTWASGLISLQKIAIILIGAIVIIILKEKAVLIGLIAWTAWVLGWSI